MINQSINTLEELLDLIISNSKGYYIEQKSIVSSKEINGHTIYSRFKYFNGKITPILLKQHLQKEINLAIALNSPNAMVYEYLGKHQEAFVSIISYFYKQKGIKDIYITTYENSKLVLYIRTNYENYSQLYKTKKEIDIKIEDRLTKEWRVLPNIHRPDIGNLILLPREFIKKN